MLGGAPIGALPLCGALHAGVRLAAVVGLRHGALVRDARTTALKQLGRVLAITDPTRATALNRPSRVFAVTDPTRIAGIKE